MKNLFKGLSKKAWFFIITVLILCFTLLSGGCEISNEEKAKQEIAKSQVQKEISVAELIKTVGPPALTYSIERENIAKRIEITNDRNKIGWIYLFETGRIVGRFPVRGKVTSGTKRLTSTEGYVDAGNNYTDFVGEQPDEMGAFGSSNPYIFWFDPAGGYHQFNGTYFYSDKPYQIQLGAISVEIDYNEVSRYKGSEKQ